MEQANSCLQACLSAAPLTQLPLPLHLHPLQSFLLVLSGAPPGSPPDTPTQPKIGHPCAPTAFPDDSFYHAPKGLGSQTTEMRNRAHCPLLSAQVLPFSSLDSPRHCPVSLSICLSGRVSTCFCFFPPLPGFLGRLFHSLFHLSPYLSSCFNSMRCHLIPQRTQGAICVIVSLPHSVPMPQFLSFPPCHTHS